ncbi:MAG: antitoxin [Solirubrobacterales bacterium]
MSMLMNRRLQILIDDGRHERLTTIAAERGVSVAAVVREAIDRGLPDLADRRRKAGRRLLDSADMSVPEPPELLDELERLRGRRA